MSRLQGLLIATAIVCITGSVTWQTSARAADYTPPCVPPPQCITSTPPTMANPVPQCINPPGPLCAMPPAPIPVPVQAEFGGNWYLRGDIGVSTQKVSSLYNVLYNTPGTTVTPTGFNFDSAPTFGVGLGYQFNEWFRMDVTGEYRSKANFKGADWLTFPDAGGTGILSDNYTFSKSEWAFMANAYVDLGTWWCVTPFVGAGLGLSYNTIHGFRDDGLGTSGGGAPIVSVASGADASVLNFAWALHAGLSYKASQNLTFELAYRYISLGDGITGDLIALDGTNTVNNPMHIRGLTSHDIRFGVRFALDAGYLAASSPSFRSAPAYYPPPPVQQQQLYVPPPQPTYQQPVYQQPAYQQPMYPTLQRRG